MTTITERERQEAAAHKLPHVYRYHYKCDDGDGFSAVAPSEAGAFRVLNAERPGMRARYVCMEVLPGPGSIGAPAVSDDERAEWERCARGAGQSLHEWLRALANNEARETAIARASRAAR